MSFSNLVTWGKYNGVPDIVMDAGKHGWRKMNYCNGMMGIVYYGVVWRILANDY